MKKVLILARDREKFSETFIANQVNFLFQGRNYFGWGTTFPYHIRTNPADDNGNCLTRIENRDDFTQFLNEHQIQAVLANYATTAFDIMEACEATGIPLIVHFHAWTVYRSAFVNQHVQLFKRLFDVACKFIAVSKDMMNRLETMGAPTDKIVYRPCGVDERLFRYKSVRHCHPEKPVFLYVGRFTAKKNPLLVIEAFKRVCKRLPGASLVMIGDGELMDECRQRVEHHALQEQVTFTGILSNESVAEWMQQADIFVQHPVTAADGNREGTPCALLEACFSGLPVITTRHGGIPDIITHDESGWMVTEGDVDALVHAMISLTHDKQRYERFRRNAHEAVRENFSLNAYIKGLETLLEDAVNGH